MKSRNITDLLILICALALGSCGGNEDPDVLIVNTWKLTEFTPSPKFPIPDSIQAQILNLTVTEFTADHRFKQTGIGRTHTGTYTISEDGKRITYILNGNNQPFVETIIELTKDKLSTVDQNGNKMTRTN